MTYTLRSIVFISGRFKIQILGFDRVTGLSGSNFFFKKLKLHHFSKNNQRIAIEFLTGSCRINRVTPGFFFSYFFSIQYGFSFKLTRQDELGFKIIPKSLHHNQRSPGRQMPGNDVASLNIS